MPHVLHASAVLMFAEALQVSSVQLSGRFGDSAIAGNRQNNSGVLIGLRNSRSSGALSKYDGTGPKTAAWFDSFSEDESTFDHQAELPYMKSQPATLTEYGKDPSSWPHMRMWPAAEYAETESAGPADAWQTFYPKAAGGNEWRSTPEGWISDYRYRSQTHGSLNQAAWFDSAIAQFDRYGRVKPPSTHDPSRLTRGNGWIERAVNSTIKCSEPGCVATSTIHVFDSSTEEVGTCRMNFDVHPTDFDCDLGTDEGLEYIMANDRIVSKCQPGVRGCNATFGERFYPCLRDYDVSGLISDLGTIDIEAKITREVDECPFEGYLLNGEVQVTCQVRKLVDAPGRTFEDRSQSSIDIDQLKDMDPSILSEAVDKALMDALGIGTSSARGSGDGNSSGNDDVVDVGDLDLAKIFPDLWDSSAATSTLGDGSYDGGTVADDGFGEGGSGASNNGSVYPFDWDLKNSSAGSNSEGSGTSGDGDVSSSGGGSGISGDGAVSSSGGGSGTSGDGDVSSSGGGSGSGGGFGNERVDSNSKQDAAGGVDGAWTSNEPSPMSDWTVNGKINGKDVAGTGGGNSDHIGTNSIFDVTDGPLAELLAPIKAARSGQIPGTLAANPKGSGAKLLLGTGNVAMQCAEPGCTATTIVLLDPLMSRVALNGGTCLFSAAFMQTDYDDHLGVPENIDFLKIEDTVVKSNISPGENPCNMEYKGTPLPPAKKYYVAVADYDITDMVKVLKSLLVSGKNSPNVDECPFDGYLLNGVARVDCFAATAQVATTGSQTPHPDTTRLDCNAAPAQCLAVQREVQRDPLYPQGCCQCLSDTCPLACVSFASSCRAYLPCVCRKASTLTSQTSGQTVSMSSSLAWPAFAKPDTTASVVRSLAEATASQITSGSVISQQDPPVIVPMSKPMSM
eukprot:TRINITY_DN5618_c0_g1_i1.p1 TRINITY_DN5618_c0_g1~~TRINITY_DN5618_c0_g1_i1.p1  ORF type:complete len:905 (+),score=134.35 TRINITY_DN5618_c0_g1_i1:86-2800(+)